MLFFKKNIKNYTDEQLLQLVAQKNADAFDVLYDRYSKRIFAFFYRMLWQRQDLADDFTQDIFLKILEKASTFDISKKFSTWLYSIASNMCKNAYRDVKVFENIETQNIDNQENIVFDIDFEDYKEQLEKAIDKLSPSQKMCFVMRFFEDFSLKEIAMICDIPEGTVKSRLHFSIKKIATELHYFQTIL